MKCKQVKFQNKGEAGRSLKSVSWSWRDADALGADASGPNAHRLTCQPAKWRAEAILAQMSTL